MAERCPHRLQHRVAVGPVHQRFKSGGEGQGIARHLQLEIRERRLCRERSPHPATPSNVPFEESVPAMRGEDPEVGIVESIIALQRRVAGRGRVPRSEVAATLYGSRRLRNRQIGVISHGRIQRPPIADAAARCGIAAAFLPVSFGSSISTASLIWTFWMIDLGIGLFVAAQVVPLAFGRNVDFHSVACETKLTDFFGATNTPRSTVKNTFLIANSGGRLRSPPNRMVMSSALHRNDRAAAVPQQDLDGRHLGPIDVQRPNSTSLWNRSCRYWMACARNVGSNCFAMTEAAM